MKSAGRILAVILLLVTALFVTAGVDQSQTHGSPIHAFSCTIEKVNQCLAREATAGYVAIHVAATIMDRSRTTDSPGYGIWRSEDPVLITRKSDGPKRQTVAIIDDLAKREQQLNQAGAAGMRLLPNEVAALRSWGQGVSVDGYAALFEQVSPASRFEYRVVDVADKAVSEKLKKMLSEGFRAVAFVAPAIIVMERGAESGSKIDEYRVLQGFDSQHVGPELTKDATAGFRVVTAGVSNSGLLTTILLEHAADDKQTFEYQVFSGYNARELERKLNETAPQGYSPVPGGILPITTSRRDYRGMASPPQRVELIVGKPALQNYSAFKVLNAFGKDFQSKLDAAVGDGYEFLQFVDVTNDSFVILGHPAHSSPTN